MRGRGAGVSASCGKCQHRVPCENVSTRKFCASTVDFCAFFTGTYIFGEVQNSATWANVFEVALTTFEKCKHPSILSRRADFCTFFTGTYILLYPGCGELAGACISTHPGRGALTGARRSSPMGCGGLAGDRENAETSVFQVHQRAKCAHRHVHIVSIKGQFCISERVKRFELIA